MRIEKADCDLSLRLNRFSILDNPSRCSVLQMYTVSADITDDADLAKEININRLTDAPSTSDNVKFVSKCK